MLAADAVQQANSGHPGLPLGAADIAYVIWSRFLKQNPSSPTWYNRDRFILSAGHGSALLYSMLHLFGYPLSLDEVKRFRQWGSKTPGHPEYEPEMGIEMTTGPLGQGLATSVGVALAEAILAARFNQPEFPVIDHYTYVLASDGDLMEGVSHEAASFAGQLGLGKLIVLYDDNHISIDGPTELSLDDDALGRFAAYHWHVQRVDGHNMAEIDAAIRNAQAVTDRPSIIACRTHIGFGSPRQDNSKVHGSPLGDDDLAKTKQNFNWPVEPRFYIPEEVVSYLEQVKKTGVVQQAEWKTLFAGYKSAFPELAKQLELIMSGELPVELDSAFPIFPPEKALATRVASGKVLDAIAPKLPMLIGGSADLTPSNNTRPAGAEAIARGKFKGSYVHYGVREHGMGSIMNGLALHGLRPYGGTFLIFSDYVRPAVRLSALMGLPVIYVFTHDSIGLGEDGPTHQPIEQVTSLRAIPNLLVIRPCDANETAAAWKTALENKTGPTALILSRQDLAIVSPTDGSPAKGAYVLADAEGKAAQVVLLATGSEVGIALAARQQLAAEGIAARVVSMPCWELFDAQPEAYKASVIPAGLPCVAVEAGVSLAWGKYLGGKGKVIGIDRFGASAPYKELFKQFGFTAENIVSAVKSLL